MKPPPFFLGTALAFWGWQSGLLIPGVLMGLIIESARFVQARWEFSDDDFSRVWTFCALLFLGAGVYAFTDSGGPSSFGNFFQDPGLRTQSGAGIAAGRTAAAVFRWLPMIFFPFLAAQLFSTRGVIPLATISFILRRRQKKARAAGRPSPQVRNVDISWAYGIGTLVAASVHGAEDQTFFWGLAGLLAWALWSQRSRRFGVLVWVLALATAVGLGFAGQRGFYLLQRYVENLNAEWLARFMRRNVDPSQTTTALGQVGNVKTSGRIVVRVTPHAGTPAPTYLREASYRIYSSTRQPTWQAGSSRSDYANVGEEPPINSGNWTLIVGKTNTQAVNISCYLGGYKGSSPAGLLPVPAGSGRFEKLPAYVLSYNSAGAILAEGPGLVVFDALFGPGLMIDSPPGTGTTNQLRRPTQSETEATNAPAINEDLDVPEREQRHLDQFIAEFKLRDVPRDQVLRIIAGVFADKFNYRTWQPPGRLGTNETALGRFLLKTRAGHCEYFATATTLLLRRLGLPARYAVGYAVHETSGSGYVVRLRDAHAWCLAWNPRTEIWDDFDTTPASWVEEEKKHASAFQWLGDAWTRLGFEFAKLRWGQTNLRLYLLIAIVPGLAVLLWQIIFRRGRRRKKGSAEKIPEFFNWPGLDSEFYQLEQKLAERGLARGGSEPLNAWLTRVATAPGFAELGEPLQQILRLHYRHRFDPVGLNELERESLRQTVRDCSMKLAASISAVR